MVIARTDNAESMTQRPAVLGCAELVAGAPLNANKDKVRRLLSDKPVKRKYFHNG